MRNAILPLILMGCPRQTPVESYSSDVVMTDYDLFENGAYGELRDRLVDRVDPTFGDLFAESDVDDPEASPQVRSSLMKLLKTAYLVGRAGLPLVSYEGIIDLQLSNGFVLCVDSLLFLFHDFLLV